jgi:hypothetical protein
MCRRRGDPIDWRHLPWRQVAVHTVLEQLDEPTMALSGRPQLMRDVGEELTLRGVGARHFAVQPLELRGPLDDADRLATLAQNAVGEERHGGETEATEKNAERADVVLVRDNQQPRKTVSHFDWRRGDDARPQRVARARDENGIRSDHERRCRSLIGHRPMIDLTAGLAAGAAMAALSRKTAATA